MKKRLHILIPLFLSILLVCSCGYSAIAVTDNSAITGEPSESGVDPTPSESYEEPEPDPQPDPTPDPDPGVTSSYDQPDYNDQTPADTPDYSTNDNYADNYSFVDPEPGNDSEPAAGGYTDDGSGNIVSSTPNELYDVSKSIDTNELDESDWKMALDFSDSLDGTGDFNFIKNNKSADDATTFQWMLYLGIAMIAGSLIGVIAVIVTCINKRKKILAANARGSRVYRKSAPAKTIYQPKKSNLQKYDTAEIDIDLGNSKKR